MLKDTQRSFSALLWIIQFHKDMLSIIITWLKFFKVVYILGNHFLDLLWHIQQKDKGKNMISSSLMCLQHTVYHKKKSLWSVAELPTLTSLK